MGPKLKPLMDWAVQSLNQGNMKWLLHCGFFVCFPPQASLVLKISQNGSQGTVLLKHGRHITLKSWKRSSLSWSLLAIQVQFVIHRLCSVFCNCDPPVCLGVEAKGETAAVCRYQTARAQSRQPLFAGWYKSSVGGTSCLVFGCWVFFFSFGAWVQLRGKVLVSKKFKEVLKNRWRGQANAQEN